MLKAGFYLLGEKGYFVLGEFIARYGVESVAFVEYAIDASVENDCSEAIVTLCKSTGLHNLYLRGENKEIESCICFAVGWRWIIQNVPRLVVLHDSILPKYRGFSPLVNMLINGESKIGVTALIASESYDEGDILAQAEAVVDYPIKIKDAIKLISPLYAEVIFEVCELYIKETTLVGKLQDHSLATYSIWRDNEDYKLSWSDDAKKLVRACDALGYPFSGALIQTCDEKYRLLSATEICDVFVEDRAAHLGKVIFYRDGKPVVVCGKGLLRLDVILDMNGNICSLNKFRTRFL